MSERSVKPEIYLLLLLRFKPEEIAKLGYSKQTIYKYSSKMNQIIERLKVALARYELEKVIL